MQQLLVLIRYWLQHECQQLLLIAAKIGKPTRFAIAVEVARTASNNRSTNPFRLSLNVLHTRKPS